MTPLWFLFLSLNMLTPAQAVDFSRPSFLSVKPGESVTLHCSFGPVQTSESVFWYKQIFGEMPETVGKRLAYVGIDISEKFKTSGFKMDVTEKNISLTISHIKKEDEGLYFCGTTFSEGYKLSSGTYLAVTGNGDVKVSVLQHGMWDSIRCESGSSTHSCVYNFSKNILNFTDTGTYYCAMALCGNIVSGNRTPVQYENVQKLGSGPEVIYLAVSVAVCLLVIFAQAFIICKVRNCEQSRVRSQKCSTVEKTSIRGRHAEEMNYAALHFNKRNTNKMKKKGEKPKDCVYSEVRQAT